MNIELSKKQLRRLLDMVYIGNWVLNSTRGEDRIKDYDNNVFFEILAEDLARRDMDDVPIDESNYDELTRRIDAYIDEFERNGTDNIVVESEP